MMTVDRVPTALEGAVSALTTRSSRVNVPHGSVTRLCNMATLPRTCTFETGASAPWIVTVVEPETQALLGRNPWNTEFARRVAFLDHGGRQTAWTADRTEFLGRNRGPDGPDRAIGIDP